MYLTSYTTKSDDSAPKGAIKDLIDAHSVSSGEKRSNTSVLVSLGRIYMRNHVIGGFEGSVRLKGLPMVYCSERIENLSVGLPEYRKRKLLPSKVADLQKLDPNSTHGLFANNFTDNYYRARPNSLEDWSLMDVFSWFDRIPEKPKEKTRKKKKTGQTTEEAEDSEVEEQEYVTEDVLDLLGSTEDFHDSSEPKGLPPPGTILELQNDLGFLKRRTKPRLATTPGI
jgi:hypothetical protein